jgi:CheY-like chemotaxis protein
VKAILDKAGYQVFSAFDAMQGVMMARQVQPDLVILDVMMPAGGGVSVYERIRALSSTFSTPVLVYSASPKEEVAQKIPEGPLTVILQKPAAPSLILETVEKLLASAP